MDGREKRIGLQLLLKVKMGRVGLKNMGAEKEDRRHTDGGGRESCRGRKVNISNLVKKSRSPLLKEKALRSTLPSKSQDRELFGGRFCLKEEAEAKISISHGIPKQKSKKQKTRSFEKSKSSVRRKHKEARWNSLLGPSAEKSVPYQE